MKIMIKKYSFEFASFDDYFFRTHNIKIILIIINNKNKNDITYLSKKNSE